MNNDIKDNKQELPKAAIDEIPTPKEDAVSIIGLVKKKGRIKKWKLRKYFWTKNKLKKMF